MSRKNNAKGRQSGKRGWQRYYTAAGIALITTIAVVTFVAAQKQDAPSTLGPVSANGSPLASGVQGDADTLDLSAFANDVVVVNFMAGWCQPCWAEIPGFVQVYEEHKDRGLVVIAISLQTPLDQTQAMIEQLGISYPVYQDESGEVALQRFKLRTMPTTFIFKGGREVERLDGEVTEAQLRAALKELL
jgi:thiol-disulfide isomerase/thioredoxin